MNAIQFTTVVGADGLIHPPTGVTLPQAEVEVSIRLSCKANADLEERAKVLSARRGYNWDSLPEDVRAMLVEDVKCEDRGVNPPRPGAGAFKGSVLYMAPDFDAPLEDMKEYMG